LALAPGDRLGPYEIVAPLGSGGMGEVYRARDGKLNRDVAIKVLPDAFALDADRLARFTREAQTLASLNHPNIAAIYGIEGNAIVMELVEGKDLSALIGTQPLDLREALVIARQIAEALEAAHDAGVVHRDLKPANIKVRDDGTVKVLDFGLAKAMDPSAASNSNAADSPTLTAHASQMGLIIGTAAYMAPEQAKGRSVDKRADIWAFGVILYEMLSGQRGYQAEDISDTLAAVLTRDVNWSALPAGTPPRLTTLLRDCLMRDTKQRLRDIGDARRVIGQLLGESPDTSSGPVSAETVPATAVTARTPRALLLAATLVVVSAGGAVFLWNTFGPGARGGSVTTGPIRLSVSIPSAIHATRAAITRDGRTLIVGGNPRRPDGTDDPRGRIYARRLDEYEFKSIPGTEGVQGATQSPDGRWLAFIASVSEQSTQQRIAKVPIDGSSPPVVLSDWDDGWSTNVVWLEDGDLLVASERGTTFFRLPTNGGAARPPIEVDTGSTGGIRAFGQGLPGDRGVFVSMESWGSRGYQLDQWLLDPKTGKARRLFENAGNATYVPSGHIVFSRGADLMAAPFDLQKLAVTGEVTALPGSVRTLNSWTHGNFSLSKDGTLVFAPGGRLGTDRTLVTVDASGHVTKFVADARSFESVPRVSADGRSVAAVISNAKGTYETWVAEADRPGLRRVLVLPNADCGLPVWSPDSQRLAYQRTARDTDDGIYVQRADGTGEPQAILKEASPENGVWPTSFAPDGSGIIVSKAVGGRIDMLFVPLSAAGSASTPRPLRATPSNESDGCFSPDGRLVAFDSDESGRDEVYVAGYRADGALGPPTTVSSGGGVKPAWANDGRRLFYYNRPDRVMSVDLSVTPRLTASAPVVAYDLKKLRVNPTEWDIMPDGRLLAIQKGEGEGDITDFNVVLNWLDELGTRVTTQTSGR